MNSIIFNDINILNKVMIIMAILAVVVFVALQYFKAGYGYLRSKNWGPMINNKVGWVIMELPSLLAMLILFILGKGYTHIAVTVMTSFFLIHYLQRSLIFPFLMKGNTRMPITVILMGVIFNLVNVYMIATWLFILSEQQIPFRYEVSWLYSPQFIIGSLIFIFGMTVNLHSDYIIRHLRKPGDTKHYIPKGGMFKYVSSANYFGEITEWLGFAILTWSLPGLMFFIWTFANLAPRANSLYKKYSAEFGEEFTKLKRKRVIPFIY